MRLDSSWTVTINGQTVRVDPEGGFFIPNIAAADQFGPGGPGTPPDFRSDDWFQVQGRGTVDGTPMYAYGEPFQIVRGQVYAASALTYSTSPPPDLPLSLRIDSLDIPTGVPLFLQPADGPTSTRISVKAIFADESEGDRSLAAQGTTVRTSHPRIAQVSQEGSDIVLRARGVGTAFVTATHLGAAAVREFVVTAPCRPTTVVGQVQSSGGSPVAAALVFAQGGSNAPAGTAPDGRFSFSACYTPGVPFSVVAVSQPLGAKAVQFDVEPIPDGVTDAGPLVLEFDLVFWNAPASGSWSTAANWHTGQVPSSSSHVFINAEHRAAVPPPVPYTVTLNANPTLASFSLDSPNAVFAVNGGGFQAQFTVTGSSQLRAGRVLWRWAAWKQGTLDNDVEMIVGGNCFFGEGLRFTNRGRVELQFDSNSGELQVYGSGASFHQASTTDALQIDGRFRIRQGASFSTASDAVGITIGATGLIEVRDGGSRFDHTGGLLTVSAFSPGLIVDAFSTTNVDGGNLDIEPNAAVSVRGTNAVLQLDRGVYRIQGVLTAQTGGTLVLSGGQFVGADPPNGPLVDGGTLQVAAEVVQPLVITARHLGLLGRPGAAPFTLHPGQVLRVEGFGADSVHFAQAEITSDLINRGTIELDSIVPAPAPARATLRAQSDSAFVNEGSLHAVQGQGGVRNVEAGSVQNRGTILIAAETAFRNSGSQVFSMVNEGTLAFDRPTAVRITASRTVGCLALSNETTGRIEGPGLIDLGAEPFCGANGERTLRNSGTLATNRTAIPSTGGTLQITGNLVQTSAGHLRIRLDGPSPGRFNALIVTRNASLAGTLDIEFAPASGPAGGFVPSFGQTFRVLQYGSRTGTLTLRLLGDVPSGVTFQPVYTSSGLDLVTISTAAATRLGGPKALGARPVTRD